LRSSAIVLLSTPRGNSGKSVESIARQTIHPTSLSLCCPIVFDCALRMLANLQKVLHVVHTLSAWYVLVLVFASSLVVNALQILATVFLSLLVNKKTATAVCQWAANLWWPWFPYIMEVWARVPYRFTGDHIPDGENAILICNHGPGSDFITGIVFSARVASLRCGKMMTLMKDSIKWIPSVGWIQYFQGALYLKRSWEKDQKALLKRLHDMEHNKFPRPFWIGIYPEGTRITPKKKADSIAFAKTKGLPQLQNVLLPRTKGFTTIMSSLPTAIDAIYDATVAYTGGPIYFSNALFGGKFQAEKVHLHMRRILIKDLPRDEEGLHQWMLDTFFQKDKLLENFEKTGTFPGEEVSYNRELLLFNFFYHFLAWSLLLVMMLLFFTGFSVWSLVSLFFTVFLAIKGITFIDQPKFYNQGVSRSKVNGSSHSVTSNPLDEATLNSLLQKEQEMRERLRSMEQLSQKVK